MDSRRHRLTVVLLALVVLCSTAVVLSRHRGSKTGEGSGVSTTQTRRVSPFGSLELAGSAVVAARIGPRRSVVVHADDNLIDRITTVVRDGRLVVDTRGGFSTKSPMRVEVVARSLSLVSLTGSGVLTVEGLRQAHVAVRLPGSGVLDASGAVDRVDATLSGSGDLDLRNLVARGATAAVSGSGRLQVHATETLHAAVSGTGALFYSGSPATVTRSVTGTGAIIGQ
jgi:hypothetical protein